jgi:hypothetical protein
VQVIRAQRIDGDEYNVRAFSAVGTNHEEDARPKGRQNEHGYGDFFHK